MSTERVLYCACPARDAHSTAAARDTIALVAAAQRSFGLIYEPSQCDEDLVRVRSRYVRRFLESKATHLWWLDSDVCASPYAIAGMLASKHDVVLAPYPRKMIDWATLGERVRKMLVLANKRGREGQAVGVDLLSTDIEALGQRYPFMTWPGKSLEPDQTGTSSIAAGGLGCAIFSREALQKIVDETPPELWFTDEVDRQDGTPPRTAAVCMLSLEDGALYSEDQSLCKRARAAGYDVRLYLGKGAPVGHVGYYFFRGKIESFIRPSWLEEAEAAALELTR